MKKTLISAFFVTLSSVSQSARIQNEVDKLINQINPNVNLGAVVVDLTSGETLYRRNAGRLYIPASNMKLFSEAAALMVLGPDYHFKNQLSMGAGKIQQGVLQGNVYIQLSGDPSFNRENLKKLLSSLKELNINTIQGNVYIDSSVAGVTPYPPGWLTSDLTYSYGAPNAPVMLDANRLTVTVNPGARIGDPAIVEVDDGGGNITLNNQATTKAKAQGCGVGFSLDKENHLTVRGCVGVGQWAVQQRMAIKNPLMYARAMIQSQLAKEHIQLNGQVQLGKTPGRSLLIATQYSKPLSELMADTLKPSDNLYADSLYLHAAAKLNGAPVNWQSAQPIIKNFLQSQTGIDFTNAIFTDGSGLSRYSLVTPEQTISLLKFLYQRFPLSYEYIAALPISGRDGTLQKRFRIPSQQGFVRAKTGTMVGINSLSGYLYTANGHTLAFALYINRQPGKPSGPGRPVLDALCTYFLKNNPSSSRLSRVFSPHQRISFQSNPTQAERQKTHQAKWRRLESVIRMTLKDQPVNVVYRNNELVVIDNQVDPGKVWSALQSVIKKYPFAVMLSSKTLSINPAGSPTLLWVQTSENPNQVQRIWSIHEAT
ncbi:D-alanyl-D-alanine carboxypeptidase/D-alanyl-D-alanine endopeptidase [Legionella longbeachae]|uniref:Putative D-alanyl-D-alanine carboxypeptidase/D-alanyl-D-alanine-endopeptidase n=1 Tax=Legionella longbeachae serogroup 1 (strain NSW150) TaxID=661367 RepID=D3HKT1_LEGLN|nr:D-alanyl-D-alanine carboxypeptidase/D-alanyl-D-alanine-endopeptidase [Legionella longbeachae]VEE03561.1 D-alanyl-D-alanine carboxypeptidase/D-alanyl-D -alanine-endopeptidase [Legionella oakridgensis]ARB93553.1 D-alanyl-D-alanine carboxypeptidase/D-alanyl-D-alanine-endopeptidase [Legionella longbeachae]ARM33310.1 D-alanyl-D-alanine carboxypeptidase/D-alanyl-D-alanine-endopeptidase [Legionella longbeachae]EEZ93823.1 D-alanyl-D-alanine carboxypeptidase/D-alanyl-D-alanine-endopeptidase [Legionel